MTLAANAKEAPQVGDVIAGEVRKIAISCAGNLDEGETLTGTPTLSVVGNSDLSFSQEQVSSQTLPINGLSVPAGLAVQCSLDATNAVSNRAYRILVTCSTSASQTIKGFVRVNCI